MMTVRSMDLIVGENAYIIGKNKTQIEKQFTVGVVSITSTINNHLVRHNETFITIQPNDRIEFKGEHPFVSDLSRAC